MSTFFSIPKDLPESGISVLRERGLRCRTCGKETEDLRSEDLEVGDALNAWCSCCETVTGQVVRW